MSLKLKVSSAEAVKTEYDGVPTRVLSIEYLIVICLQTGRAKDRDRVRLFHAQAFSQFMKSSAVRGVVH
jgi:hypothetical protein